MEGDASTRTSSRSSSAENTNHIAKPAHHVALSSSGSSSGRPTTGGGTSAGSTSKVKTANNATGGNGNAKNGTTTKRPSSSPKMKQFSSERMLQLLRAYAATVRPTPFANVRLPPDYKTPCGQALGAWLGAVGKVRRKGRLPPKLEEELTGLGVVWDDENAASPAANVTSTSASASASASASQGLSVVHEDSSAGRDRRHPRLPERHRSGGVHLSDVQYSTIYPWSRSGYGHGPSPAQPYRAPWAEITTDTTGRIVPSAPGSASAYQNHPQHHQEPATAKFDPNPRPPYHHPVNHHNDDDDGFFPMPDSFDDENDPDRDPDLYKTNASPPVTAAGLASAPRHPAAPSVASADPTYQQGQGPSGGLSSLAEASALLAPAGHPMRHSSSHSNKKRKRGQREPQWSAWRSANNDLLGEESEAAHTMDNHHAAGGIVRSFPTGSEPSPRLPGRGRPRCPEAEARLKHAEEPLLPDRDILRDAPWEVKYDMLREYKRRYGTANVPTAFCSNQVRLGQWLATQRQARRKGTLSDERVAMLEELGVAWKKNGMNGEPSPRVMIQQQLSPDKLLVVEPSPEKLPPDIADLTPEEEAQWAHMVGLLKKFRDREGDTIPSMYHVEDSKQLGLWLWQVKDQYRCCRLGEAYVKQLEEVGVTW